MKSVGAYEAKTHLSELLDRVSRGEKVLITKHGLPVAVLVPFSSAEAKDRAEAVERMTKFRERGYSTGGVSIREMVEAGRRK